MTKGLSIDAIWERLEVGPPEERACFAQVGIRCYDQWLTEADDAFVGIVRQQVHLSAYLLAQWLAWNWWRLRWEPRRGSLDWSLAHHMPSIGGGYVWPNITITSDGKRVVIQAEPTEPKASEPLRYLSSVTSVVQANEFDGAIDAFLIRVLGKLEADRVVDTNFQHIWGELVEDRADPKRALFRKFEALLGADPGEADPDVVNRLIEDRKHLGGDAMEEIAASDGTQNTVTTSEEFAELARTNGTAADLRNTVRLESGRRRKLPIKDAAWKLGAEAARAIHAQERLEAPISDERLCEMAGVSTVALVALKEPRRAGPLSFV